MSGRLRVQYPVCGSAAAAIAQSNVRYGIRVANVGDGWFVATEKSDYIQAIGLSSANFQQFLH